MTPNQDPRSVLSLQQSTPQKQPMPLPDGLFFNDIRKSFGGTVALGGVTMNVERGEIVALLGENGAGKSTLIKILGNIHSADSGEVVIDREIYRHRAAGVQSRQAVAFIHQDLGLIEWMNIAENMALAQGYPRRFGVIDWRACEATTANALNRVGCDFSPTKRISSFTRAEKSLIAIARALAVECDFLVLDEPSASLPRADVERLFKVLRQLRDDGVGMIYVSHRLDEVFDIADRVVVLRDGKTAGVRDVAHTSPEELVDLIVGRKPKTYDKRQIASADQLLTVTDLVCDDAGPLNFNVHSGEILGLVGLRGAGQENIGRCLFGAQEYAGTISLSGHQLSANNPGKAMREGIGLIARDRLEESVAGSLSVRENMFINPLATGRTALSFCRAKQESNKARVIGEDVGLRPNDPDLPIESLSGGNQQKVVVGRWLETDTRLLVAEDPTAGVDVGAKGEIYSLLGDMVDTGVAVVVISTDFEEVASICQRALVFSRGQIVAELSALSLTTEALIQAASAGDLKIDGSVNVVAAKETL